MDFQFYPTPRQLALRMWAMFKNRDFVRVLEPSAGDGALVKAGESAIGRYRHRDFKIDCCEIDVTKHPSITEAGGRVIELDVMRLTSGNIYSHVIMNPPFAQGVAHVLHLRLTINTGKFSWRLLYLTNKFKLWEIIAISAKTKQAD